MTTERNTQNGHEGSKPQILYSSHSREKKKRVQNSLCNTKWCFQMINRKIYNQVRKKLKLALGNLIRKCGLTHTWEMSLSPQHARLLESDGEINHWSIGFRSQLGRTGWTPALWNGLGGAALWTGILHCLLKALTACAVGSSWPI